MPNKSNVFMSLTFINKIPQSDFCKAISCLTLYKFRLQTLKKQTISFAFYLTAIDNILKSQ